MSISYQSSDPAVLNKALKVQELNVSSTDQFVTISGVVATIDVGSTIDSIVSALFVDNSAVTETVIQAASRSVSGSTVALTLPFALAANDNIELKYIVSEA